VNRKKLLLLSIALVFSLISSQTAYSAPKKSTGKKTTIIVEIDGVKPLKITGTKKQVDEKIKKLEAEALALVQQAIRGDSCRVTVCTKIDKDEKSGNTIERPLTDTEIAIIESKALIKAIQKVELVKLAQKQNSGVQMVIPISVDGVDSTISGTAAQIAIKLTELQTKASDKQIDPCAAGGCTKIIVNATTGETTVLPLSAADLAQRATDRAAEASRSAAAASAARESLANAEPTLTLSVQLPNQGFGTSGTRSQLEQVVRDLESRAAAAAERAAADPCAGGCAPGISVNASTGVVTVVPVTPEQIAQRSADAVAEANRSAELAAAARETLNALP
jgi:hypothetical protein